MCFSPSSYTENLQGFGKKKPVYKQYKLQENVYNITDSKRHTPDSMFVL